MPRILLADDHALVRAGLRALLSGRPGMKVCCEASDGLEVLRLLKCSCSVPDIVLMDIAMPGLNGLEATQRLAKLYPRLPVLCVSMHATKAHALAALSAGATGYVLKNASVAELEQAIQTVLRGEKYLSPAILNELRDDEANRWRQTDHPSDPDTALRASLTTRQREVLQLLAEGYSTRQIAARLHLSIKTIETHRAHLMQRLDVRDLAGLVRAAIRLGLASIEN